MLTDFLLGLYKRIFYTYKDNKIRYWKWNFEGQNLKEIVMNKWWSLSIFLERDTLKWMEAPYKGVKFFLSPKWFQIAKRMFAKWGVVLCDLIIVRGWQKNWLLGSLGIVQSFTSGYLTFPCQIFTFLSKICCFGSQ